MGDGRRRANRQAVSSGLSCVRVCLCASSFATFRWTSRGRSRCVTTAAACTCWTCSRATSSSTRAPRARTAAASRSRATTTPTPSCASAPRGGPGSTEHVTGHTTSHHRRPAGRPSPPHVLCMYSVVVEHEGRLSPGLVGPIRIIRSKVVPCTHFRQTERKTEAEAAGE